MFKMMRLAFALAAALLPLIPLAAAQDWPGRPVKIVVAAAAGGPIDVFGRVMAERLSPILGQNVFIENVPGAGGMVGGQAAARAEPDGHTVLLGTIATHTHSQNLYKAPLYNAATAFVPVGLIAEIPLVLIVRKDLPVTSMAEFVDYAKRNAARMNYGSAGIGSATHLGCALMNGALGLDVPHVPYRGTGPAMQDLMSGRIDYLCEIVVTAKPQIESGMVKAIATLSGARSAVLPDLATAREGGFANLEADTWAALFLPKGTPDAIVAKLNTAMVQTLATPETKAKLADLGATIVAPDRQSPRYLGQFVKDDIAKWAAVTKASGIQPN
jgi:tripartite-type tricarboxylate transporter receptor subunit TctC